MHQQAGDVVAIGVGEEHEVDVLGQDVDRLQRARDCVGIEPGVDKDMSASMMEIAAGIRELVLIAFFEAMLLGKKLVQR
jgi:hypothetical protein